MDLTSTILQNVDLLIDLIGLVFLITIVVLVARVSDLFGELEEKVQEAIADEDEYI